jgi:4'-phosphopantetheinyl transferase EntD
MIDSYSPEFLAALRQASTELGLADYYEPCVRPLFHMPMQQWPMCCGGGCSPCAQTLIAVASRVAELLQIDLQQLR